MRKAEDWFTHKHKEGGRDAVVWRSGSFRRGHRRRRACHAVQYPPPPPL